MKTVLLILGMSMVTLTVQAKVSDFNNLINENIKDQNEFHKEVKESSDVVQKELPGPQKIVIVDNEIESFNAPSKKMRFKKETFQYQVSRKKVQGRVATEIKDAGREF